MSDQYVGEIRMFAGNYAPQGWEFCDGSTLPITGNELLYSLIGVTYGGDARTNFQLPDLRGRVPIHMSSTYPLAGKAGTETVTLSKAQLPTHTHTVNASANIADTSPPANALWATTSGYLNYATNGTLIPMNSTALSSVGGNQAHNNIMPSLTISFIIATKGLYPQQS